MWKIDRPHSSASAGVGSGAAPWGLGMGRRESAAEQEEEGNDQPSLPSAFGDIRAQTLEKVAEFRKTQLKLFEEHVKLESHPGQDVDFLGAFEDTFHGEESAESRFMPLGKWFEAKEAVIERLTGHLERACQQMVSVNDAASTHISQQGES